MILDKIFDDLQKNLLLAKMEREFPPKNSSKLSKINCGKNYKKLYLTRKKQILENQFVLQNSTLKYFRRQTKGRG